MFDDIEMTTIKNLQRFEFYDGERLECPIAVVGPDGSSPTMLRVYAYGGNIGRIATIHSKKSTYTRLTKDKEYANYLGENWLLKDNEIDKNYLQYLKSRYIALERYDESAICRELCVRLRKMLDEQCHKQLDNPEYLDLILKAAQKKFLKKGGNPGERRIQTEIVRRHMKKDSKADWCVIDMEYTIPEKVNPARKSFKPDIVVFDKNYGFGFIELKYNNESEYNLEKHYMDVRNVIKDNEAVRKITTELKRRSSYLCEYGLIDTAIHHSMQNSAVQKLWQGFLFVGGEQERAVSLVGSLAEKQNVIKSDKNCRFVFFPYKEESYVDSIDNIKLEYHSMQTYEEFVKREMP